jgi:N-formylglutamate amidohydrolase
MPDKTGFLVNDDVLNNEIQQLTDWYTDDLFYSGNDIMIKAEFSRVFCDVERFSDDSKEIMAAFGMGVLYEKNDFGVIIRNIVPGLRTKILTNYYWKHHSALNKAVNDQLRKYNKALILDCHSFPDKPFERDLNKQPNRPDMNIGTDNFHTPPYLLELSVDFFQTRGYSVGVDWPYSGAMVPTAYYKKDRRVKSIMLEINRKLYLKEDTNKKSENYAVVKKLTQEFITMLRANL